jgi:nucleoside-diphosphate-sugar epimerase
MIIGSGLIAKSFINFKNQDDKIIFASGVSNSLEENDLEYQREINLLKSVLKKNSNKKIIYFSTTSIFNIKSKYTNHKLEIEKFITQNFNNYCIYRLPQIVGKGGNRNNLINFLKQSIIDTKQIIIFTNSLRSILDIEDLVVLCSQTCDLKDKNILNIAGIQFSKIEDIVKIISEKLNMNPILSFRREKQDCYIINSDEIDTAIKKLNINSNNYIQNIINKYI